MLFSRLLQSNFVNSLVNLETFLKNNHIEIPDMSEQESKQILLNIL